MINNEKRHLATMNKELAMKLGYIGQVLIKPNFLVAVVRIITGGPGIPPLHVYYCGHANTELCKKFNIKKSSPHKYE